MIVVKPPENYENLPEQDVKIPPSKYVANRLIVMAALAKGKSTLYNLPVCDDIDVALDGIKALGAKCDVIEKRDDYTFDVKITGFDGKPKRARPNHKVYCGDNGTFARLIAPVLLLCKHSIVLDASEQMRKRPMAGLFEAMRKAGAKIACLKKDGFLPAIIDGEYKGGVLKLSGDVSSQYFSGLILSAPYAKKDVTIVATTPMVSAGYVEMTTKLISELSEVKVETELSLIDKLLKRKNVWRVKRKRKKTYSCFSKIAPVCATSLSYFIAMATLGIDILIKYPEEYLKASYKGESYFTKILKNSGFLSVGSAGLKHIFSKKDDAEVYRKKSFFFVNVKDVPDTFPTFLVLAVIYAHHYLAKPTIENINHIRYKESNRVEGMCEELKKIGADIVVEKNHVEVLPKKLKEADFKKTVLSSLGDHRLAMAFSLLSFVFPKTGVCIDGEKSVSKTFPHYFEVLKKLGFSVKEKKNEIPKD